MEDRDRLLGPSVNSQRPFALDPTPLFRYVFFSILNTPPNFLWQQALETWFPAYTHPSEDRKVAVGKGAGHKRLHLGNTFMKLLLDMTLGATVNTVLFVAAMSGMRGAGQEEILETVQRVRQTPPPPL
ncbi:MAG: hypothetical protein M1837_003084 [Sclerophora amabilis]|nr:MAG: hypothetical protein M1837_003084 [Sclerophora amabilis]